MKFIKLLAIALLIVSANVLADVERIRSNGNISGVPSYLVECSSGTDYIIYKKNGSWYRGSGGHMGDKYNSWSKYEIANFLCG